MKRSLFKNTALAAVIAISIAASPCSTGAASFKYASAADTLNAMGLYAGISTESFVPDLGSTVTKEQGVTLLLRALGQEAYAQAMTESQINEMLKIFSDSDKVSGWARKYMAAGISLGLVNGNTDFTLGALDLMDSKMMSKLILINTDYVVDVSSYQSGPYILRDSGAFTLEEAAYFMSKMPLIRDDLVGMIFLSLKLRYKGTTTSIISNLVKQKIVIEELALRSGAYTRDLIDMTTAKVAEYEAAPYATPAQQAAGLLIKSEAEQLLAKFALLPDATTPRIVSIKNELQARIAAQLAKVIATATSGG